MAQVRSAKTKYVTALVDGTTRYYKVKDASLLRGLLQVGLPRNLDSLPRKWARSLKQMLTVGVTASPDFIVRNFVRDAAHAWAINKDGFSFGSDSMKGINQAMKEDADYRAMMFSGSSFQGGYIHGSDPDAGADMIRRQLDKQGLSRGETTAYMKTVGSFKTAWEKYRDLGDKLEKPSRPLKRSQLTSRLRPLRIKLNLKLMSTTPMSPT